VPAGVRAGAFFDLERTLTPDAVEQAVAVTLWRRGELPSRSMARVLWCYLRYNLGMLRRFEDLKAEGARIFSGRDPARDETAAEEVFAKSLRARIYPEARALVEEMRARGIHVAIVSSTYAFLVAPYARDLGVADYSGCKLETDGAGRCTGRLTGEIPHQQNKARIVQATAAAEGLDLAHSWAFGDSPNDLPMLEAVGHAVAVNPGSGLRRVAEARGWEIARWRLT